MSWLAIDLRGHWTGTAAPLDPPVAWTPPGPGEPTPPPVADPEPTQADLEGAAPIPRLAPEPCVPGPLGWPPPWRRATGRWQGTAPADHTRACGRAPTAGQAVYRGDVDNAGQAA